jgi:hypothetical protein
LPVLNLLPNAGLPEATLDTQDASPEQSVPAGVSPPGMYGVPDTCAISDINAARANIGSTLTGSIALTQSQRLSKAVARITICPMMWSRTLYIFLRNSTRNLRVYPAHKGYLGVSTFVCRILFIGASNLWNRYLNSTQMRVSREVGAINLTNSLTCCRCYLGHRDRIDEND